MSMDIGLMLEGQNGLNWPRWQRILQAAEDLGYAHVFRSDHFTNPQPPDLDSLEMWTSLTYAASHTTRIQFGPLVTPVTFRLPTMNVRYALAIDNLSNGRLTLGMGIGWQDREHHNFGIPFPPVNTRYGMLQDALEITKRLFDSDEHVSYEGQHFQIHDAILLPRPVRPGGPPILIGGNGEKRTLPMAAKYAAEWNGVFVGPQRFRELNARLDGLLEGQNRSPDSLRRSLMVGSYLARSDDDLRSYLEKRQKDRVDPEGGVIAGTPSMWAEQLAAFRDAGADRIMIQWLDLDDLDGIELVAKEVLPQFR
jgi:F420-dependent oxidoreductase-like protein